MDGVGWALLGLLSLLWGGSFFFYKILVTALPPFTVVFGRVGLAALALNLLLILRRDPMPLSPRLWGGFLVLGVFNSALPFCCFAWSELKLSSGMAAILNATTPIFAVLVAGVLPTGERMTLPRATAVGLGFLGVIVLVGPDALAGSGSADGLQRLSRELACLGAALSYAWVGFYGRRFSAMAPLKIATGQITAAALVMAPLSLCVDRPWTLPPPSLSVWGALAGIALISTAAAYMLFFRILKRVGASNLLLVTFLVPISALSLGAVALGERLGPSAFAGMALIGLSLIAIDGRPLTWAKRRLNAQGYGPLPRLALQGDVEGPLAAVMTVGLGEAGDDGAERRVGEPFGRAAAQNTVAHLPLAGDHQDRPRAVVVGAEQKIMQRLAGAILVQAVQIEAARNFVAAPHDPPLALRLDGLRRGIGLVGLRRRLAGRGFDALRRIGGGRQCSDRARGHAVRQRRWRRTSRRQADRRRNRRPKPGLFRSERAFRHDDPGSPPAALGPWASCEGVLGCAKGTSLTRVRLCRTRPASDPAAAPRPR
jgi:drug/metabolite transporter (DMT)-like permease